MTIVSREEVLEGRVHQAYIATVVTGTLGELDRTKQVRGHWHLAGHSSQSLEFLIRGDLVL